MPCETEDHSDNEFQEAARLLVYVCKQTNTSPPAWAVKEKEDPCTVDKRSVAKLCAMLKAMDPERRDTLVYNARDKEARKLADWWERHQKEDARREEEETAAKKRKKLRKQARSKLTPAERKAVGLK